MKNGYIIVERGYEYDDNYYNSHGDDSGIAIKVFFDIDIAKKKCKELELKQHANNDISLYFSYGMDDAINNIDLFDNFIIRMNEKYGPVEPKSKYDKVTPNRICSKLNELEKDEYLSFFHSNIFYFIKEIEVDIQSYRDEIIDMSLK